MTTRLWFEYLGLPQLLGGLVLHLHRGPLAFAAPRWSPAARRLSGWLERRLGGRIQGIERTLELGRPDARGKALAYRRELFMLTLAQGFATRPGPLPQGMEREDFQRLLASYVVTRCREAISFVVMAEAEEAQPDTLDICHVAFPALGDFSARTLNLHMRPGFWVKAWPNLRALAELLRFLPGHPREWLALLRRPGREDAMVSPAARAEGVVVEEAYWQSLDRIPQAGHMFWVESSGLDPARIVLYCDRADTPCDGRLRRRAAESGFGWIDGAEPLRHLADPLGTVHGALAGTRALLPRSVKAEDWLRWSLATAGLIRLQGFADLMERHNILAFHHFIEFSPEGMALCLAARRKQVLTFWNLWSVVPFVLARYRWAIADLILAWGPLDRDFHLACGFDFKAIAEVGMIDADGPAPDDDARAAVLRAGFTPDVRFVVGVFDTSFSPMAHNSAEHVRTFMDTLVGLVERHPDWALLVKPKKRPEDAGELGVKHRLLALEAQGRCQFLDSTEAAGIVAQAADMVAGIPINSAAELGALRGRTAIHLDLTGMTEGPLYHSGLASGQVYSDVQSFAAAIERIASGDTQAVDHTAWKAMIDGFGDGLGRRRAGTIIGQFIRLRAGMGLEAALAGALGNYAAEHGMDRVVRAGDTMPEMSLWQPLQALETLQ